MKRFLVATLMLASLGGCQTSAYYAEGVSIHERDADQAICRDEARIRYPTNAITRFTPRVFNPGTTTCDAAGTCTTTQGYWSGGEAYTVDLNEDARREAAAACMARAGYARVSLPACSANSGASASSIMAPLNDDSCILRSGGTSMIVTP